MNTIATLQTVARLDSEQVFRRILDHALDSTTEQLLEWVRFTPEQFGIETPRHAPILAKKVILPHYAILNDEAQEATVETLCESIETDCGLFCTYALDAEAGIIAVYMCSVEVNAAALIAHFDDLENDAEDFDDEEEEDDDIEDEDEPDFMLEPELLIGCDVQVNELLRTVLEVDAGDMLATLDDGSVIDINIIEVDSLDGSFFIPEAENFGVDRDKEAAARDFRNSQLTDDLDEDDEEDEDTFFEEEPALIVPQIRDNSETDEDEEESDEASAENANADDDFPDEELQPAESEEQAIAAAIAEEQSAEPINWERPPVEPVAAVSATEAPDDDFAEEVSPETVETAQTEAQAPVAASPETSTQAPATVEGVSESEAARRLELLESITEQLPNDSVSEIKDGVLTVFLVKDDRDYELTITLTQQLFAGERMIDIFVLASKDGSIGRRASNSAAILDAINSL